MSKTTFTPGPWTFRQAYSNGEPSSIEIDAGARLRYNIATIASNDKAATMEGNARLIAAAPDLLAACQHALDTFGGVRPAEWMSASRAEFDMLTAAIAKAKGQPCQ